MNKIFRIVWSQATQSWVVVSELTRAHKKQSSSNAQRSAVKFSGRFIKYSAIALALLSGHSAYAAVNVSGTGADNSVAWGQDSKATGGASVALGTGANATAGDSFAVGWGAKASGSTSISIGNRTEASGSNSIALGSSGTTATKDDAVAIGTGASSSGAGAVALGKGAKATGGTDVALGQESSATGGDSAAIGWGSKASANKTIAFGNSSKASGVNSIAFGYSATSSNSSAVAIGDSSKATGGAAVALGLNSSATSGDSVAIGTESNAVGFQSMAFGRSSTAKKESDIAFGLQAATRDQGAGRSIAIGTGAMSGSNVGGFNRNGQDSGGVAIGTGAFTGVNKGDKRSINSSVAVGAGAGAGFRNIDANGIPVENATDVDSNEEVLKKAFGVKEVADYQPIAGYTNVDINEATALGRNARAIGDQAVAIGAQTIAGHGAVALGGNDITQFAGKKYYKSTKDNFKVTETIDHNQDAKISDDTISGAYNRLVGTALDTAYKATYAQDGSVVLGAQAHSSTPLGTALGTNALIRKGAFGATAIGAGSQVQANAEAAVAIGMGSFADGKYAVAAGTASLAKEGDVAIGYKAKATGKEGALAIGLGTNAQGDSSVMIGGADIKSASAQTVKYQEATGGITSRDVTEKINGKDVTRHYSFSETKEVTGTIAKAYKELTGLDMETASINFADANNKNGHASTSLGVHALSKGDLGTAIGASSRADAIGSVALGVGAHATKQNAVAIGTGSTTALVGTRQLSVNYDSDGNIVSDDDKDKIAYTFKWAGGTNTAEGDVVSFGSSGAERQLKNVAAGRVAEDSTDAINGSQLNSITKKIAAGFNTSGNVVTGSSGEFTSKKANTASTEADYETSIRSQDKIQFQVGNNLKLDRDETVSEVEVPDDFDKNQKVKKKIRKADFAYSLNPVLTNLTSAEFKGTDPNAPTTKLTNAGVTITPATSTGKKPVSLTENGLDNGGNPITNVAGNLDGAKTGTNAPTNEAAKPDNADTIKNNAATVGDVLNAGWNLQEKGTAKDFVTAYDTVNFVDGDGTTVSVENTDGKTSKIKYNANLGDGLEKDATTNKIKVKAADKSLEVTNEGVKVKAADNTLTTDENGLKVNTGNITASSVPTVADADKDKIATVGNVADAIKAAAWKATSAATTNGENSGKKDQEVKAGDTVTFEADKNIKIAQDNGKFTFSTKDNVEFKSVKVGEDKDGKKPVNLTTDKATDVSNNDPANKPTTALNVSSTDGKPTQITGVGSVLNTTPVTTTPDGSAPTTQPNVVNLGTAHGQTALSPNVLNSAATVRDLANMGWKVSSDKATGADGKDYSDVVRNADEVKFVGKNAAKVSGKTVNGVRTITVDVEVPSVETAKITQNTDGSVTGPVTADEAKKLADDLANAQNAVNNLAPNADDAAKKKAQDALKAAQAAAAPLNKVATAQNVADMINASGFTLKTSKAEGGEKDTTSTGDEVINPGKAVEMIAGKNLTVKQEANGKVTYSTKDNVEFTSVKVGEDKDGKKPVNFTTEKATDASNNDPVNKPTTALNVSSDGKPTQITGVGSTLNVKPVDTNTNGTPTADADKPNLVDLVGPKDAPVNKNAAATVGDLQNMGWVVSTKDGNGYNDVVKNANQVDFVGKNGITVTGETKDGIRTITVEAAQTPVVYTNKAGDKLVKVGDKFYKADEVENGKPKENAQVVPNGDVIASMNNGDNTANNPMHLSNIGSNLPTVNDTTKQAFDPNSTEPKAGKDNKSAPITAKEAADIVNKAGNNAATVSDVLNAGWNLQGNGQAVDFVKPFDTVNFVNGKGTKAVVETDDNLTSTVKFDVDAGEITSNTNGSVNGPTTAENAKKLADDLKKAEQAVKDLPADATPEAKKAAQDALKAAQDAAAPLNKVATAQNVADMINASGFTLKTSATADGKKESGDDEVINPGKAVEMIAGKNLTVKQEANGKVTYATKDEVEFNTVKLGDTKDGKAPVNMKTEAAKPATNNGADQPTTALNFTSGEGDKAKPTQLTGVGSTLNTQDIATAPQGKDNTNKPNVSLVNLVGTDAAPVNKNAAATVGDLQNMGWVVSTKDGNGYTDVVKNANQVDFKGTGLATVTGETDKDGIRTITVNVDAQKTVEAAQTPVVYTNKDGDKLVKVGDKFYKAGDVVNGKPKENAQEVPKGDVIASMNNGDNKTNKPMQLANIGSNLPTVNDTNKQAFDPNSTTPKAGKDNKSAPITAKEAADIVNNAGNNAATVSDVLNAGWNLQNNGEARDFVKPYDTVNFINGKGTVAVVETADDATSSTVKFDVDAGEITSNTNGSVNGPTTAENAKKLADDLKKAEQAVKDLPADATPEAKKAAQDALKAAQDAAAPLNKVATAQNVADMINASGFTLKTSATADGKKESGDDEVINPGKAVEMIAGKNLTVKQEANGKVTYATKDDVSFNTVNVGDNTYVDENGKPVTKNTDGTYTDSKGQPIEEGKVTKLAPVAMKAEKAKPATNNGNKAEDQPTTALNVSSSDGKPTQITGVGSTLNVKPVDTNPNGTPTTGDARPNLVDLVGTKDAPVNKNAAATVGDLQNMGWVVSTKDGNGYTDVVKNANQVDFKGTGLATVTGETKDGIRTITVNVDAQKTVEAAQTPVVYTNKDGDKLVKVGDKFYKAGDVVNGKPKENAQEVPKGDVIASMNNGDNKTNKPMQLANIGSNLPTVNDTNKQAFDPNSTTPKAGKDNKSAPITAKEAADIVNNAGNNAATVSDVLNAGWNLQNNGEARDFVKPYDTVNFINGKGTVAVVETADDATSSTVKFDVDAGEITSNTNGSVNGPTTAENAKKLADDLKKAEQAVKDLPADATPEAKKAAQDALKAAQDAAAPLNKVATAQNVADMINASGFTLKTSATADGKKESGDDEVINPGKAVEMIAGKNLTVKQEANGKVTYATKDDVSFNTVNVGDNTYVDENGKPVTKNTDGTYTDSKGQPIEEGKVTKLAPVAMKAEKAKPATNNGNKAEDQPTTALNVSSSDGKPTQITGVGSTLNVKPVDTNPNGTPTTGDARPNLVDLVGTDKAPVNKNAAATVGDLQNMGWIVGAPENGYVDTVKNANKVDFKGENGISVTGKTNDKGVREITISVAEGKVTNDVKVTKADGTVIDGVKGSDGKLYKKGPDGKPDTSKEITLAEGDKVNNEGSKFVSGNAVATAIQESGWNVGLADSSKANAAFSDKDKALSADKLEKVNPNDNVRFADGKGTKASVATVERVDEFGKKVTDTYVKFDVDAGEITADTTKPGAVKGPVTADEAKKLADDLKKAEQAVKDLPADATPEAKKAAQDALKVAQDAAAPLNKVATAQNVAEAINNSGWRTNSTTATGGAKDTLINPGKAVNFEAGKNMEVAQTVDKDGNVAYTYKTKDDVQFNSVQFGDANGPKITNNGGNINVSGADGKAPTKITGVAAGDISPNSTDAVNGAQIYALVGDQSNVNQTSPTYTKVDLDENGKPSYTTVNAPAGKTVVTAKDDNGHDVPVLKTYNVHSQKEIVTNSVVEAIYNMNEQGIKFFHSNDGVERPKQEQDNNFDSSARGKFATAIGSRSKADGTNAVAIGFNSVVTGNDSISIGTGNRVTGNNSGAFGDPSTVSGQGSYSVGNNNTVSTNDTFVLGNDVKHTVENSAILGAKSTARGGNGSKTGTLRNLKQDGTQGASTTAGSTGTVSTATVGYMTYGGFQGAKADGVVSVGAAGNERRVQNVAAGEISSTSTDAINGSQLYAVAAGIGHKLGDLDNKINKVGKRADAGTASALAAATIPQAYTPGKSLVGIAAGNYQGQNGLAVGMSRISDNGKIIIRLSGTANTQGKTGVAAGVGYQW